MSVNGSCVVAGDALQQRARAQQRRARGGQERILGSDGYSAAASRRGTRCGGVCVHSSGV